MDGGGAVDGTAGRWRWRRPPVLLIGPVWRNAFTHTHTHTPLPHRAQDDHLRKQHQLQPHLIQFNSAQVKRIGSFAY